MHDVTNHNRQEHVVCKDTYHHNEEMEAMLEAEFQS